MATGRLVVGGPACTCAAPSLGPNPARTGPREEVPPYGGKNRGEDTRRRLLSEPSLAAFGQYGGPAGSGQGLSPEASLGQRALQTRYQDRFTEFLGSCLGNWKPSMHPRGPRIFPWTILLSRSPTPAEAECPGKTWRPGAVAGCRRQCHAGWRWNERAGHTPMDGFSPGDSGLRPPGWLRVLLRLKLPHHGPRRPTRTERLQLSTVWAKLHRKGLGPPGPQSPRARTPFSVKKSAAYCPWCPQKAFNCGEAEPG